MSKHTKPPWNVCYGYADYLGIDCDESYSIATIELDEHGAKPTEKQEANAHLIAASPTMYRTLQKALHFILSNVAPPDEDFPSEYRATEKEYNGIIDALNSAIGDVEGSEHG